MDDLKFLVEKHRELDLLIEKQKNKKTFISDWDCNHPFYREHFKNLKVKEKQISRYNYVRGEDDLTKLISKFHHLNGESKYSLDEILTSHGSTSLISAFFIWLRMEKVKYIYYIPPMYFTFHFFARINNIALRPITKEQLFEKSITLNLPKQKSIIVLTDPVWYAGCSIPEKTIDKIVKWQKATQSLVFIDGSFQYFKWDESKHESTSAFDKDLTFRLICPSKSIATHGFRFSYLLLPNRLYDSFDFILDNLNGSSNLYDISFAKKNMELLISKKSNNELIRYTRKIFLELFENEIISSTIDHNCGYFIFAKLNKKIKKIHSMDGKYFEQEKYKDYIRINLLSSCIQDII